ncbi:MAG: hypothetical protein WC753_04265 [Candidatus Gracilibacteria bacterium]
MISTTIGGSFGERVQVFGEGAEAQGWSSAVQEQEFLGLMEGVELGILQLIDGQTVFAEIRERVICVGEDRINIPDSSIFADASTLIAHIRDRTGLLIERLEVLEPIQ